MLNKVQFAQLIEALKQQIQLLSQLNEPAWELINLVLNRFPLSELQLKKANHQLLNMLPPSIQAQWQKEQFQGLIQEAQRHVQLSQYKEAMHSYQQYFQKKAGLGLLADQMILLRYGELLLVNKRLKVLDQWVQKYEGWAKKQGISLYQEQPLVLVVKAKLLLEQAELKKVQVIVTALANHDQNSELVFQKQLLDLKIQKAKLNAVQRYDRFQALFAQKQRLEDLIEHISCLEENGASVVEQYLFFKDYFPNFVFGQSPELSLYYLKLLDKLDAFDYCVSMAELLYEKYPEHFEIKKYWQILNIIKEDFKQVAALVEDEINWLTYLDLQLEPDDLRFYELFDAEKYYYFVLYLVKTDQKNLLQTLLSFDGLLKKGGARHLWYLLKVEYYLSDWLEDPHRFGLALTRFKKEALKLPTDQAFWILYLAEIYQKNPENINTLVQKHPKHFAIQLLKTRHSIFHQQLDQLDWFQQSLAQSFEEHEQQSLPINKELIDCQFDIFIEKNDLKGAYEFYINRVKALKEIHPFGPYSFVYAVHPLALLQYIIEESELPYGIDHISALEDIYASLVNHHRIKAKIEIKLAFLYALIEHRETALRYLSRAQARDLSMVLETQILIWACEACDRLDALELLPYWTKDLISRAGYQAEIDYFAAQSLWQIGDFENAKIAAQRSSKADKSYLPADWILGKYQLTIAKNPALAGQHFKRYAKYKYIGKTRKIELTTYEMTLAIQQKNQALSDKWMKQLLQFKHKKPIDIYLLRAELLYEDGQYQAVIDFLRTKEKLLNTECYLFMAKSNEKLKEKALAESNFQQAIELSDGAEEECVARYAYSVFLSQQQEQISAEAQLLKIYHIFEAHQYPAELLTLALEYLKTLLLMGNQQSAFHQYHFLLKWTEYQSDETALIAIVDSWMQALIEADLIEDIEEICSEYLSIFAKFKVLSLHLNGYMGCYYFFNKDFAFAEERLEQLYIARFYVFNDYYLKTLRQLDKKGLAYVVLNEMIEELPYEYEPRKWIVDYLIEDELFNEIDLHIDFLRKYHPQRLHSEDWDEKLAQARKYQ